MKPALLALALVACTAGLARADGIFPDCPDDPEPCNTGCASQGCGPWGCSTAGDNVMSVGTSLGLLGLVAYRIGRKRRHV